MRGVVAFIILLIIIGCSEKVVDRPVNLIPAERMELILYDLAIFNAAIKTNPNRLTDNDVEVMDFIYDKYGIDSAQFTQSDIYYASMPAEYEKLYKNVESRVLSTKEVFDKEKTRRSDSIKKIVDEQQRRIRKQDSLRSVKDTLP